MAGGFWDSEKVLRDVPKVGTKSTFYRFKEVKKGNKKYIDVREHFTKADGTEQYTSKGTAIPVDGFEDFLIAVRDIGEFLKSGEIPKDLG